MLKKLIKVVNRKKLPVFQERTGKREYAYIIKSTQKLKENYIFEDIKEYEKPSENLNGEIQIKFLNSEKSIKAELNKTILENAIESNVPLKYSCSMGGCGACKVKLLNGNVNMRKTNCLSSSEINDNYILTCISYPKDNNIILEA